MRIRNFFVPLLMGLLLIALAGTALAQSSVSVGDMGDKIFTDIDKTHENYDAINYLKDEGVVEGYEDGSFGEDKELNRAELVKIMLETLNVNVGNDTYCYSDVKGDWYAKYVCKATDMGMVEGYGDGTFKPERPVNFAEASKIIAMAFQLSLDESSDGVWYSVYVIALEDQKAIPVTIDAFDKDITRGDMAEMVWRVDTDNKNEDSSSYDGVAESDAKQVRYITLNGSGSSVNWTSDGYADKGFKVVWSRTPGPEYPTRDGNAYDSYKYLSSSDASSADLHAFDGTGTYYVRVCKYTGGGCDTYSNEVALYMSDGEEEKETEKETDSSSDVSSITLSGSGSHVSWSTSGYSEKGFKVAWSKNSNPTYPTRSGDKYKYLSSSSASSADLTAFDGSGTYYVRVCEYLGGACGVYSNQITVTLEGEDSSDVSSITLSGSGSHVTWTTDGVSSKGFKVVWSLNSNPTYPTRDGDKYTYLSSSSADSADLTDFDGSGTYNVRVCEYLGGACGVYSNQIQVEL